jgi:diketogulonate reductase-like aldo/keto reductase
MILELIHQEDTPLRTKKLINALLESGEPRKEAWKALDSLVEEGHISTLGGSWFLTPSGMELMGWLA